MTIGTSSVTSEYLLIAASKSDLSLLPGKYPKTGSFLILKSETEMSVFGTTEEMDLRPILERK